MVLPFTQKHVWGANNGKKCINHPLPNILSFQYFKTKMTSPILDVDFDFSRISMISHSRNHGNYDLDFKKKVIIAAEKSSNREAEKLFGVSESNIRRWRKLKGEIFGFGPSRADVIKKKRVIHLKGRLAKNEIVNRQHANSFVVKDMKSLKISPSGN